MKKLMLLLSLLLCSSITFAGINNNADYLGGNLTLTTPIGFGIDYEHIVVRHVGVGGIIRYWHQSQDIEDSSWRLFNFQGQGIYHFIPHYLVDPYVGIRLGIENVKVKHCDSHTSDLFLTVVGGLRYFLARSVAIKGNVELRIAGEKIYRKDDIIVGLGIDFEL